MLLNHVRTTAPVGDLDAVVAAIDAYGRAHGGMIHLGAAKGDMFEDLVRQTGARRVLELGTNYGYSALRMARALGPSAIIETIEIDPSVADIAAAIIAHAGAEDRIRMTRGAAADTIRKFQEPFDVIFLDHEKQDYFRDLQLIERLGLLRTGGTLLTDNVVIFRHSLEPFLRHLRKSGLYDSTLHRPDGSSDGIERSIRRP